VHSDGERAGGRTVFTAPWHDRAMTDIDSPAPVITPYGAWTSPFTSDFLVSSSVRLGGPTVVGPDFYWLEGRPTEGGRQVIVRRTPDGVTADVTAAPFNARTRVHEYGGGAAIFDIDGTIYASSFEDQKLYRVRPGGDPEPVTHAAGMRYADGIVDAARQRLICVREDHTGDGEAVNTIAAIDLATGDETILVEGRDFFSSPRLAPDGRLCWLAWDHPNMPWDGCELSVATFDDGGEVANATVIAGGRDESIAQPVWAQDGTLYFASDRSGYWNIYRFAATDVGDTDGVVSPVLVRDNDFAKPAWVFGITTYDVLDADHLAVIYADRGEWRLAVLDTETGELRDVATPYTEFDDVSVAGGRVLAVAASPTRTEEIVSIDPASGAVEVIKRARELDLDERYVSIAEPTEFPTSSPAGDEQTAHAFFYPPRNVDHVAPKGEKPPLIVMSHGGPTSAVDGTLKTAVQFWTSRGFAVVDVNYGGSTGYGRAYWQRLRDNWGVVDVDDCVNAALYLAREGRVDCARLAIRGGSAGGYTTLAALTFRDVFAAGASHFGVGDAVALATETHKFESRYLDSLIGPYPATRERYLERSPINHVEQLNTPAIFFQGLDDRVVPPNQAESMVAALSAKGVPVAYIAYEGEGHGFRKAANIKRTADAELYFYGRIFGFTPAGEIEPVEIANLPGT
jgi:dipeptidyl aminopeptidase/acylaminoacyl peptidase